MYLGKRGELTISVNSGISDAIGLVATPYLLDAFVAHLENGELSRWARLYKSTIPTLARIST
jgi:hypothetical protein